MQLYKAAIIWKLFASFSRYQEDAIGSNKNNAGSILWCDANLKG